MVMLENLAKKLKGEEPLHSADDWKSKLLAGEPSVVTQTYLLFLPAQSQEEPNLIPFEILNAEWRAWWEAFTVSIIPEQETTSADAKELQGMEQNARVPITTTIQLSCEQKNTVPCRISAGFNCWLVPETACAPHLSWLLEL